MSYIGNVAASTANNYAAAEYFSDLRNLKQMERLYLHLRDPLVPLQDDLEFQDRIRQLAARGKIDPYHDTQEGRQEKMPAVVSTEFPKSLFKLARKLIRAALHMTKQASPVSRLTPS